MTTAVGPPPASRRGAWLLYFAALTVLVLVLLGGGWLLRRERFSTRATAPVLSSVDGAFYRVHGRHADSTEAADRLARAKHDWVRLLRLLRGRYGRRAGPRGDAVRYLLARYDPTAYVENSPLSGDGETSYTTDKGKEVAICLRAEAPDASGRHPFVEPGVLFYVHLHEMAHIATGPWGHGTKFWRTFAFLLESAVDAGLYRPRDYARSPVRYCGMTIEYCPLFDPAMPPI